MIRFDEKTCRSLDEALSREWLETNGLGGYSSSTLAGLNTRRYHGLLVAATKPPVGRAVLLSKLEETLIIGGRRYELSSNQYPGAIHPQGYSYQTGFRLDPFPIFTYEVEGVRVEKTVLMVHGENTTVVQYEFQNSDDCAFEVRPLIAFRDYHSMGHENDALDARVQSEEGLVTVKPYPGYPALHLAHDGGELGAAGFWYRNFEYREERARGFDFTEDLFNPFVLKFDLSGRKQVSFVASTERREAGRADEYRETEIERRRALVNRGPDANDFVRSLVAAADQFVVARGEEKTVIAGYHWFSDWGRDTMIALPGLTLVTNRPEVARSILSEFARHVDEGMLPNRFPDAGERPEYNTVDATLWYFEAVRAYLAHTNDEEFVRGELYGVLADIVEWHVRGTRYNIRVTDDGLLHSGADGVQLTWMDAKVGDWVVTPRRGKAVEIQALWYNALRVMEELARKFGDGERSSLYGAMAERARAAFNEQFWNEEAGCLYDVVDGEGRDAAIRPNQIFAASLAHSMLDAERVRRVVEKVERDLLTPYGLRSLAPEDAEYRPRYEGDSWSRDGAYHQGTVWAWLMGPFVTAYLKAHGRSPESLARGAELLLKFKEHLSEAGLGQVSEIFDAEAPHTPRGCVAQAWSVAELLRAAVEDVDLTERAASSAKTEASGVAVA
ncbi:MAG TPA: amylo-alpha-1,6-glucosidase [Pyrinomonadaceae bacterium]|nr:amylo-alpha-1,6-glucosidase [Pyrinomonadaceae bacterium]